MLIIVKESRLDLFNPIQGNLFRLKWGVGAGLVDTALTRVEIKKKMQVTEFQLFEIL